MFFVKPYFSVKVYVIYAKNLAERDRICFSNNQKMIKVYQIVKPLSHFLSLMQFLNLSVSYEGSSNF